MPDYTARQGPFGAFSAGSGNQAGSGFFCLEQPSNKEVPNMRVKVTLRCNECKQRNYNTMKNKKNTPDKLELNKYCPFCRKHTVHSETK